MEKEMMAVELNDIKKPSQSPPQYSTLDHQYKNENLYSTQPQKTNRDLYNLQQVSQPQVNERRSFNYAYLIPLSVVNAFCCCICFGSIALYHSIEASAHWSRGDVVTARYHARKAKIWNVVTLVVGALVAAFVIAYNVVNVGVHNVQSHSTLNNY